MNSHLSTMPHGQSPMPPPRRQHDISYSTGPPNMPSLPAYMGYPLQMNGHPPPPPPPYSAQQYPHWYPAYPQVQVAPRTYQPQYGPVIISSYTHAQPIMASAHLSPSSLSLHTGGSTPLQAMSPPVVAASAQTHLQEQPCIPISTHLPSNPVISPSVHPELVPTTKRPFRAPLPWLSVPELRFPPRAARRRRKDRSLQFSSDTIEFPAKKTQRDDQISLQPVADPINSTMPAPSEPQTPATSVMVSDANSTQPTTPSSPTQVSTCRAQSQFQAQARVQKSVIPLVPVVPIIPYHPSTPPQSIKDDASHGSESQKTCTAAPDVADALPEVRNEMSSQMTDTGQPVKPISPACTIPRSWADLVRSKELPRSIATSDTTYGSGNAMAHKPGSLADALSRLCESVTRYSDKVAFLEPRGLVNTGNMCYMNSVLQALLSCAPFYQFLDYISHQAAHSFSSDVPLIDAMIMFMKEFRVIDAAQSEEQLRLRIKPNELEEYGEAFIPEFVYQIIRQLPRFRDMRRGHQQDAQEFLGFLLEEMHEECIRASGATVTAALRRENEDPTIATVEESDEVWLEVGHKHKPAITRSSGHVASESPITKIFGGKLRSEFRVPGNKNSVTLEPYQPLQLDIGSPDIHNIVDALKGLTKPESIRGDFNSSRGPNVTATKQLFIESLPPVLILHLKRFQYDSVTRGTQKIWKQIGYPLDLEIPRDVFAPHRRNIMMVHGGPPKYRLVGVIYHHGSNASGGHYTVDVRRQDGREWVRLDDTVIRRIRSDDVARAGSEEVLRVPATAFENHRRETDPSGGIYGHIGEGDHTDSELGWNHVHGTGVSGHTSKKSSSAPVNGSSQSPSGVGTPMSRYGSSDKKENTSKEEKRSRPAY